MEQLSSRDALLRFRFSDYGTGSHRTFKKMMTRALANRTNIRNWYSRWVSRLRPDEDAFETGFPDTRRFYTRMENEEANLTEYDHSNVQYIVPGEDNDGDYISHDW